MKAPKASLDDFSFKIGTIIVLLVLAASGISYLETIAYLALSIWAVGMVVGLGLEYIRARPPKQPTLKAVPLPKPKRQKPEPPTTRQLYVGDKGGGNKKPP